MILGRKVRLTLRPAASNMRVPLHKGGRRAAPDCSAELERIERQIEHTTMAARLLADELGALYAVFRTECTGYDDGRSGLSAEIMMLSRRADVCIQTIYALEHRRKELLVQLGL